MPGGRATFQPLGPFLRKKGTWREAKFPLSISMVSKGELEPPWMCVMVCPCDAIARDLELQVARKCDLCVGREAPAYVTMYPTEAPMWKDTPESSCDGPSTSTSQLPI